MTTTCFPPTVLHACEPLSLSSTAASISSYLAQSKFSPHLHPNALLTPSGVEFSARGGFSGGIALHQLQRVEKGLRGERVAPDVDEELRWAELEREDERRVEGIEREEEGGGLAMEDVEVEDVGEEELYAGRRRKRGLKREEEEEDGEGGVGAVEGWLAKSLKLTPEDAGEEEGKDSDGVHHDSEVDDEFPTAKELVSGVQQRKPKNRSLGTPKSSKSDKRLHSEPTNSTLSKAQNTPLKPRHESKPSPHSNPKLPKSILKSKPTPYPLEQSLPSTTPSNPPRDGVLIAEVGPRSNVVGEVSEVPKVRSSTATTDVATKEQDVKRDASAKGDTPHRQLTEAEKEARKKAKKERRKQEKREAALAKKGN